MNPAVKRLLDDRATQDLRRRVDDDAVLDEVARLLDANDGAPNKDAAVMTSDPAQNRKSSAGA